MAQRQSSVLGDIGQASSSFTGGGGGGPRLPIGGVMAKGESVQYTRSALPPLPSSSHQSLSFIYFFTEIHFHMLSVKVRMPSPVLGRSKCRIRK